MIQRYIICPSQLQLNALVTEVTTQGPSYVNDNLNTTVNSNLQSNFDWLNTHRDPVINWISAYRSTSNSAPALGVSLLTLLAAIAMILCNFH